VVTPDLISDALAFGRCGYSSLDGAAKKAIMLSNNNLSSEGSSDSLITTSKPKHDDYEAKERTR
jgi:hypothetical protein